MRRKWRHQSSAEIVEDFTKSFTLPEIRTLLFDSFRRQLSKWWSLLWRYEFTLSVAKKISLWNGTTGEQEPNSISCYP